MCLVTDVRVSLLQDINHSGDGGLYGAYFNGHSTIISTILISNRKLLAELLQNRAFQVVTPGTSAALVEPLLQPFANVNLRTNRYVPIA